MEGYQKKRKLKSGGKSAYVYLFENSDKKRLIKKKYNPGKKLSPPFIKAYATEEIVPKKNTERNAIMLKVIACQGSISKWEISISFFILSVSF